MRVLIVDDSESMRNVLASYVAELGVKDLDESADGASAVRLLAANRYDCVLLDLHLPGLSGLDVLRALQTAGNRVPVLVVTTETSREYVAQAFEAGATDYLPKPFDKESFFRKVRRILGIPREAPSPA